MRELLQGGGDDLQRDSRHRQLAARLLGLRSVLLAQRLERCDVGLVVLGDVRNDVPGVAEMFRRFPADVAHRLAFNLAPFREVRERLCGRHPCSSGPTTFTRHHAADVRLHVFGTDASTGPAAREARNVNAQLARQAAHRRRRGRGHERRIGWFRGCRRRRLLAGATIDIDDLTALLPGRVFGLLRLGLLGLALAAVFSGARGATGCRLGIGRRFLAEPTFFGRSGRLRFRLRGGLGFLGGGLRSATLVERQHDLSDFDLVPLLDLHLAHRAVDVGRDFDRRLVGFQLQHRLVFLQRVAGLDEDSHYFAGADVLAELWNLEFSQLSLLAPSSLRGLSSRD